MIIKIIPETEAEIEKCSQEGIAEREYRNVREFMIFGNNVDEDGDLADFHEWRGAERYLMGSLDFFYNEINDKRKMRKNASMSPQMKIKPPPMKIDTPLTNPNKFADEKQPMIKKGSIVTELQQLDLSKLDLSNLNPDYEVVADEDVEEVTDEEPKGLKIIPQK